MKRNENTDKNGPKMVIANLAEPGSRSIKTNLCIFSGMTTSDMCLLFRINAEISHNQYNKS
ncbi:hypothetical protein Hanom_Chr01g00020311 [Helianthus anomalus]